MQKVISPLSSNVLGFHGLGVLQLYTESTAKHNKSVSGGLLHLDDGEIVTLGLSDVGHIVLELEARQVVIDVLQDQVDSHVGAGGRRLSFHHQAESRGLLKVQAFGFLNPDLT